ncbi:hypothetical protein JAAARDRAFT_187988 [Jaapia argillacea MUCL 33604]|uniref:Uncharacterized protein n=1 Tax=Jaapia argillacea MUCL 33604 TaxID=933084 RepID=A0A067QMC8_9AGAM|nr:hypothetical protein JAAARDRAFT_187988 [Jaapia argillacea MUCL 33604]
MFTPVHFSNAFRCIARHNHSFRRTLPIRHFSTTPIPAASEPQNSILSNIKNTTLFEKIADKPEVLQALQDFAVLLQKHGIDASSGKPPSTTQMLRLAANSEFREGASRVAKALQDAGIDVRSKEAMQELIKAASNK